jgi:hypothetical protein
MNTRFAAAFVAAAALIAVPALASDPVHPKKGEKAEVSMSKRYCVVSQVTGTILKRKECMTRGEWIAATGVDPAKK